MHMDACSMRFWVMGGVALAMALFMVWLVRTNSRQIVAFYVKKWGIDAATVAAVRAPGRYRLNSVVTWLIMVPLFAMVIVMLAGSIGEMVPAFRACESLNTFSQGIAVELTALVYALPLMTAGFSLLTLLTPHATTYRQGLMRLRREDLPDHPTLADFEAALPLADRSKVLKMRLVAGAVFAAAAAVIIWLTANDAAGVLSGTIAPHSAASPKTAAAMHGLSDGMNIFLRVITFIMVPYALYLFWQSLTASRRVLPKIAARWSLTSDEVRVLFKPMYGRVYRGLSLLFWSLLSCGCVGAIACAVLQDARLVRFVLLFGGFIFASVIMLGLRLMFCAGTTIYIRLLSSQLQSQRPTEGVSAAMIAAAIDRKEIRQQAWQLRRMGLFLIFMVVMGIWRLAASTPMLAAVSSLFKGH